MKQLGVTLGSILLFLSLFFSCAANAHAATSLYLSAPAKSLHTGDRMSVSVKITSPDQSINAISGSLLFPAAQLKVLSVSKERSIVNLWTREPSVGQGSIPFEGIVLNPGFQGAGGTIFTITFEARRSGIATINFTEGAVLANDGLGTNIIAALLPLSLTVTEGNIAYIPDEGASSVVPPSSTKILALPVITEYSASIGPEDVAYLRGKGEPGAVTKIVFRNTSFKSLGEQFIASLQTKKKSLNEVLVKNDPQSGEFEYRTPQELIAGAYNATPFLVDEASHVEKPGFGVQFFVSDSPIVRILVVVINILVLLIPVVGLIVLIYFIPWYSFRKMRVIGRKFGLEERKIDHVGYTLEHPVRGDEGQVPHISPSGGADNAV